MLYQFEVSGFKSFNEKFSFRLDGAKEYSFNREAVRNDVIKTGIVYGVNGIGKSNLGLALFDIIFHGGSFLWFVCRCYFLCADLVVALYLSENQDTQTDEYRADR